VASHGDQDRKSFFKSIGLYTETETHSGVWEEPKGWRTMPGHYSGPTWS
jgi:hypothetical protein